MILSGNYYGVDKQGWINQGEKTIRFPAKINHLPVYSRCNILLKNGRQKEEDQNIEQLKEVHCKSSSQPHKEDLSRPSSQFSSHLKLQILRKSMHRNNELTPHSDKNQLEKDKSVDRQGIKLSQTKKTHHFEKREIENFKEQEAIKKLEEYINRQKAILKELTDEKAKRQNIQNDYNVLLKEALKNKFNIQDDGRKFSGSQDNDCLGLDSLTILKRQQEDNDRVKEDTQEDEIDMKQKSISQRKKTSFITDDKTQRYNPKINRKEAHEHEESQNSSIESEEEDEQFYIKTKRNKFYSPQKKNQAKPNYHPILNAHLEDSLQHISNRLQFLESDLIRRQQAMKRQMLERDIKQQEEEIRRIKQQNNLLKQSQIQNMNRPIRNEPNVAQRNNILNMFILFMLGLLFTKAVLC